MAQFNVPEDHGDVPQATDFKVFLCQKGDREAPSSSPSQLPVRRSRIPFHQALETVGTVLPVARPYQIEAVLKRDCQPESDTVLSIRVRTKVTVGFTASVAKSPSRTCATHQMLPVAALLIGTVTVGTLWHDPLVNDSERRCYY